MTRKRSAEMVVMRKNIQNSQRSTYSFLWKIFEFITKIKNEKEDPEEPRIGLFILISLKKNEKDRPSRQASSTLAGCGRPEPEISRHWISFRRKRNFGQNLILLLPAYLPSPRGPWPPAPSRPPPPAALFWGKLYQTRFWSLGLQNMFITSPTLPLLIEEEGRSTWSFQLIFF